MQKANAERLLRLKTKKAAEQASAEQTSAEQAPERMYLQVM